MIGPLLVALSWGLLRLEGKGLREIGFDAPLARLRQFAAGLGLAAAVVALQQLGGAWVTGTAWQVNPAFSLALGLELARFNVNSVLFEELLFRGYLLYQGVRFLGTRRAVLLDAAAFGVYHWFSYGVFGSPVMMSFVFLYTGAFGLMLALAFAKTGSVALPFGLHLGWNATTQIVFSTGPLGAAWLVPADGAALIEPTGWAGAMLGIALPLAMIVGVSLVLVRRRAEPEESALVAA
ncbi:MAG TPA: CPBP family intramembrane metalloprotease [Bacteroidetes bacterium]|nr:CPBP family intramembrane metalloprotease [Bacteroidota bacterium]HIL57906.1 CPBP family intramembrane metalloprotease [Rhodothermales bacterium]